MFERSAAILLSAQRYRRDDRRRRFGVDISEKVERNAEAEADRRAA
jgi:hypothetical protein